MVVTKVWIMANRTPRGAWTKSQIQALGIDWPARRGWIEDVAGTEISEENKLIFELKEPVKKMLPADLARSAYSSVRSRIKDLTDAQISKLIKALFKEKERRDGML